MAGIVPNCLKCIHIRGIVSEIGWSCDAFKIGIPSDILVSRKEHIYSIAGDGGITFKAKDTQEEADYTATAVDQSEQCQNCQFFRQTSSCKLVEGQISPNGWCLHFERSLGVIEMMRADSQPGISVIDPSPSADVFAAGVMFATPEGKVLLLKRADEEKQWAFPGGKVEKGESLEEAARRECDEEIGDWPDGQFMHWMRRIKNGVDYTTFMCAVREEFTPKLNDEHTEYRWEEVIGLRPFVSRLLTIKDAAEAEWEDMPDFPPEDRQDATFNEADHPRDSDGKFATVAGGHAPPKDVALKTKTGNSIWKVFKEAGFLVNKKSKNAEFKSGETVAYALPAAEGKTYSSEWWVNGVSGSGPQALKKELDKHKDQEQAKAAYQQGLLKEKPVAASSVVASTIGAAGATAATFSLPNTLKVASEKTLSNGAKNITTVDGDFIYLSPHNKNWIIETPQHALLASGTGQTSFSNAIEENFGVSTLETHATENEVSLPQGVKIKEGPTTTSGGMEKWKTSDGDTIYINTNNNNNDWALAPKEGSIIYGNGQAELNAAFENLHPRDAQGHFIKKPGSNNVTEQTKAAATATPAPKGAANTPMPQQTAAAAPAPAPSLSPEQAGKQAAWDKFHQSVINGQPGAIPLWAMTKVGEKLGSNEGGTYESPDGKKYYVKIPKTPDIAKNEILASKLYMLGGASVFTHYPVYTGEGDKMGIATDFEELQAKNVKELTPQQRKESQQDFAVHAWLGNWDAVGMHGDNIGSSLGSHVNLDLGGSLWYRAQGSPKGNAFGTDVKELTTLRDKNVNPQAAALFGSMTDDEIKSSVERLDHVTKSDIVERVNEAYAGASYSDKAYKADLLYTRLLNLRDKVKSMKAPDPEHGLHVKETETGYGPSTAYHEQADAIRKQVRETETKRSPKVESSISDYKGSGYTPMNDCTRYIANCDDSRVVAMEKHIEQNSLPDMTVYRGIRNGNNFVDQVLKYAKDGAVITEPGFSSTSVLESFSRSWAGNEGLLMKIKVNAGTKGIVVQAGHDGEQELILQRGARYVISKLDKAKRYAEVTVVYDDKAKQQAAA